MKPKFVNFSSQFQQLSLIENELHLELLLSVNSVTNILSALEPRGTSFANFLSTPDVRQCRAFKNVSIKPSRYDRHDDANEVWIC